MCRGAYSLSLSYQMIIAVKSYALDYLFFFLLISLKKSKMHGCISRKPLPEPVEFSIKWCHTFLCVLAGLIVKVDKGSDGGLLVNHH